MLVQLMYASVPADPSQVVVDAIAAQARGHNQKHGLSGLLCHGHGIFLQVLEGERAAVNRTYAQVLQDTRHGEAQLLSLREVSERNFANWALGLVALERLNTSYVLKYAEQLPLTPAQFSARAAQAMVLDLVATGAVAHR